MTKEHRASEDEKLKLAAARRQIGTALALYLDDKDPVSVHCLACGGGEIAYRLAARRPEGLKAWYSGMIDDVPQLDEKSLMAQRNKTWNAFKHATDRKNNLRNDTDLLSQFSDQHNDELLFVALFDYSVAAGEMPIEGYAYMLWYLAMYPGYSGVPELDEVAAGFFPLLQPEKRKKSKASLRRFIVKQKKNNVIAHKVKVENRALVLDASLHPLT